MKSPLKIALAALAATVFLQDTCAAPFTRGGGDCARWNLSRDAAKNGNNHDFHVTFSWMVGYLSGLSTSSGADFFGGPGAPVFDDESLLGWVDNQCRSTPLQHLDDVAKKLFEERTKAKTVALKDGPLSPLALLCTASLQGQAMALNLLVDFRSKTVNGAPANISETLVEWETISNNQTLFHTLNRLSGTYVSAYAVNAGMPATFTCKKAPPRKF